MDTNLISGLSLEQSQVIEQTFPEKYELWQQYSQLLSKNEEDNNDELFKEDQLKLKGRKVLLELVFFAHFPGEFENRFRPLCNLFDPKEV